MNTPFLLADMWTFFAGLGSTILLLIAVASVFWLWALVDCAVNPRLDSGEKLVWLLIVFFLHLLGALLYAVAGRNSNRIRV